MNNPKNFEEYKENMQAIKEQTDIDIYKIEADMLKKVGRSLVSYQIVCNSDCDFHLRTLAQCIKDAIERAEDEFSRYMMYVYLEHQDKDEMHKALKFRDEIIEDIKYEKKRNADLKKAFSIINMYF